ncbi:hypothetical protein B0O99DRAFT_495809, partial [Bisporella sp. PMI_857]
SSFSTIPRTAMIVFLIALVVPGIHYGTGKDKINMSIAEAGVITRAELVENGSMIEGRKDSSIDVCTRWNNNFLKLDLMKTWQITSPALSALPLPNGPPAVAEGYLWHSYDSLFLYGGQFSDNPPALPSPVSTWQYDIKSSTWAEWPDPQTSVGNFSDGGNVPVQRSAEGAGLSVPELGKSWYFGGHLDLYTTQGWSNQIARVYLRSLLEFTHPGYANSGVESLGLTKAAPAGGVYRNITDGGIQAEAGFTERADGVLVYIPGWGESGIILGLAGGTNETFSEMNIIDIYDIANSTWYKQATWGEAPQIRVNPCAVVAAAPDGSSFNIYLYGGQNLIPYGSQVQYDDIWILTIPSFTWIKVDTDGQSNPPARAGHRCTLWDGQMVVMGGYVGQDISCDPGFYVFNISSLEWTNAFIALQKPSSGSGSISGTLKLSDSSIIQGSYGYQVPAIIQSVIGGSSRGGATATQPAAGSATAGPIATGKPPTFTITQPGSTIIQTAHSTSTVSSGESSKAAAAEKKRNVGTMVAGVVAGGLALLAAYLAFCTWLYRRRVTMYKNHVAMAQRTGFGGATTPDDWAFTNEAENSNSSGLPRMSQVGSSGVPTLGPFGTAIRGSGSAGRNSLGDTSGSNLTPQDSITPGSRGSGSYMYGGGLMPGASRFGPYERLSEEGGDIAYHRATLSITTAHSSMDDLLSGQEPSFFSVVLNPRRTLRVVNGD